MNSEAGNEACFIPGILFGYAGTSQLLAQYNAVAKLIDEGKEEILRRQPVIVIVIVILTLQQEEQERTYNSCIELY